MKAQVPNRNIDWEVVARAHLHPVRLAILDHLVKSEEAVSPKQMHQKLGKDLGTVAYHFVRLREAKLVKLSHTEPRRGAAEHFYLLAKGVVR